MGKEYIHGVLLLHTAGTEINAANLKKVVEAAGVKTDDAIIKATIASLDGVNIDEAIKSAAPVAVVATAGAHAGEAPKKKEEAVEDKGKKDEEAAAGLSSLFG